MPKGDKFVDLTRYLESCNKDEVVLRIEDVAKIVGGFSPYLYKYRVAWNDNHGGSFSLGWLSAGYSAQLNADFTAVTFTKNTFISDISNTYKPKLSIDKVVAAIEKYHGAIDEEKYTRFRSWEHCYAAFQLNRNNPNNIELLCLHLAWYLASWGMLRNSFLFGHDYLIHKPLVCELTSGKFESLFNTTQTSETISLTLKASAAIAKAYQGNSVTDTLITKILLGVFGSAPAYDRYFKDTATKYNVCSRQWNEKSLNSLWCYYEQHHDVFEKLRHEISPKGFLYTPMKLMDMCLWQIGYDESLKDRKKKDVAKK